MAFGLNWCSYRGTTNQSALCTFALIVNLNLLCSFAERNRNPLFVMDLISNVRLCFSVLLYLGLVGGFVKLAKGFSRAISLNEVVLCFSLRGIPPYFLTSICWVPEIFPFRCCRRPTVAAYQKSVDIQSLVGLPFR